MKQKVYKFESKYGPILIESTDAPSDRIRGKHEEEAEKETLGKFEDAIQTVKNLGLLIRSTLEDISPDEASVEMGVKLDAKANAFLVSSSTEVQFKFTIKWIKSEKKDQEIT